MQKKIGFSPAEVNAALSSSDSKQVSDMKETMKCFQKFLINFEVLHCYHEGNFVDGKLHMKLLSSYSFVL